MTTELNTIVTKLASKMIFKKLTDKEMKVIGALSNNNRLEIWEILNESKKPMNITQIHKKLGTISYNRVYLNIKKLEEAGLIKLTKDPKASGQAVSVELSSLIKR